MALRDHPLWQKPMHHEDMADKTNQVHWIELFYDLVHVVAIFLLGTFLTDHLNLYGFGIFVFLFVALWVAWGDFAFYNSLYVSRDFKHRIIMGSLVATIMLMSASIPSFLDDGYKYFFGAYAINRIIIGILYYRARKYNSDTCQLSHEMMRNFFLSGIIGFSAVFFSLHTAILLGLAGIIFLQLGYILPRVGVMRFERFTPRMHHLTERFSLLLLICLGEGFFKVVIELGTKGIGNVSYETLLQYVFTAFGIVVLAWMYFDFVGNKVLKSNAARTMMRWWYAHLILMLSAVMIGVALKGEVKVGFFDVYPIEYAAVGCLGLGLYISMLWLIHSCVERNPTHRFVSPSIRIFGILMAVLCFVSVYHGFPSIIGNSLYFIGVVAQIAIPMTRAYYTFTET